MCVWCKAVCITKIFTVNYARALIIIHKFQKVGKQLLAMHQTCYRFLCVAFKMNKRELRRKNQRYWEEVWMHYFWQGTQIPTGDWGTVAARIDTNNQQISNTQCRNYS